MMLEWLRRIKWPVFLNPGDEAPTAPRVTDECDLSPTRPAIRYNLQRHVEDDKIQCATRWAGQLVPVLAHDIWDFGVDNRHCPWR